MNKIKRKKYLLSAFLASLILAGVFLIFLNASRTQNSTDGQESPESGFTEDGSDINFGPPTEQEVSQAERNKQQLVENQQNKVSSSDKIEVSPVITFAGIRNGNIEVRSYVSEVYEDTGSCTATFTKDGQIVEREVEGIEDATYTRCDRVLIEPSEFPSKGSWSLVVSYSSSTASGDSKTQEVVVQ